MAERDYDSEIDAIKGDLNTLKEDVQKLLQSVSEDQKQHGQEALQRIRQTSEEARAEINRLAQEAGARGREGVSAVENHIEGRPFTSVLAAFGIGIVLGKLLNR